MNTNADVQAITESLEVACLRPKKEAVVKTELDVQVRPVLLAVCKMRSVTTITPEDEQTFHRCISLIFDPAEVKPFFLSHNFGEWNSVKNKYFHFKLYLPVSQFIQLVKQKKADGEKVDENVAKGVCNAEMILELQRRFQRETFHWYNEDGFTDDMPLGPKQSYPVIDIKHDIRLVLTELEPTSDPQSILLFTKRVTSVKPSNLLDRLYECWQLFRAVANRKGIHNYSISLCGQANKSNSGLWDFLLVMNVDYNSHCTEFGLPRQAPYRDLARVYWDGKGKDWRQLSKENASSKNGTTSRRHAFDDVPCQRRENAANNFGGGSQPVMRDSTRAHRQDYRPMKISSSRSDTASSWRRTD